MSGARRGNCYVSAEALYHLLGGKDRGLVPHVVKHEGDTHWYLVWRIWLDPKSGKLASIIIDPTVKQFKTKPDYTKGRGSGFLTKRPSKRARKLMNEMLWQNVNRK